MSWTWDAPAAPAQTAHLSWQLTWFLHSGLLRKRCGNSTGWTAGLAQTAEQPVVDVSPWQEWTGCSRCQKSGFQLQLLLLQEFLHYTILCQPWETGRGFFTLLPYQAQEKHSWTMKERQSQKTESSLSYQGFFYETLLLWLTTAFLLRIYSNLAKIKVHSSHFLHGNAYRNT